MGATPPSVYSHEWPTQTREVRDNPGDTREILRTKQVQRSDPINMGDLGLSPIKEAVHAVIKDVLRSKCRQDKDWIKVGPKRDDREWLRGALESIRRNAHQSSYVEPSHDDEDRGHNEYDQSSSHHFRAYGVIFNVIYNKKISSLCEDYTLKKIWPPTPLGLTIIQGPDVKAHPKWDGLDLAKRSSWEKK